MGKNTFYDIHVIQVTEKNGFTLKECNVLNYRCVEATSSIFKGSEMSYSDYRTSLDESRNPFNKEQALIKNNLIGLRYIRKK